MMLRMQKPNPKHIRIAITTGDTDGIGTEVVTKALAKLGPQAGVQFLVWRGTELPEAQIQLLQKSFSVLTSPDSLETWCLPFDHRDLIDIRSNHAPAQWVYTAAQACMSGLCDAMVTGPLSKTGQRDAGFKFLGHTELLAKVGRTKNLFMGFLGDHFGVVLATGHLPLAKVKSNLTAKRLSLACEHAFKLRALMPANKQKLPVALVGLNPHAGEQGLIGREEISLMKPLIQKFKKRGLHLAGPLVPDAAFLLPMRNQYSVFICPYHDQGLIPFKLVHGFDQGVHLTMGLPFVRTSVDHGTAKDIFGKNQAQEGSMFEALRAAIRLVQQERGLS